IRGHQQQASLSGGRRKRVELPTERFDGLVEQRHFRIELRADRLEAVEFLEVAERDGAVSAGVEVAVAFGGDSEGVLVQLDLGADLVECRRARKSVSMPTLIGSEVLVERVRESAELPQELMDVLYGHAPIRITCASAASAPIRCGCGAAAVLRIR